MATRMKTVFKFSICSSWLSLPPLLVFETWLLRALKEPVKCSSWQRQNLISRWRNVHSGGLGTQVCVLVIQSCPFCDRFNNILEIGDVAAQVKHAVKNIMGSSYIIDRRKSN